MEKVLDVFMGSLAGAGVILVSYFVLLPWGGIVLAGYRLDGAVGFVLLAVSVLLATFAPSARRRASEVTYSANPVRSSGGLDADAERYAKLLSQLEHLRTHANLPERICSKLEEEYAQRLKAALEKAVG